MEKTAKLKIAGLSAAITAAFGLWALMFSPVAGITGQTVNIAGNQITLNFWWMMTFSALTLTVLGTLLSRHTQRVEQVKWSFLRIVMTGIFIAAALWIVFWVGDKVSSRMFPFARPQVNDIYGMKQGMAPWQISMLLLTIIGPAEELFWRGYVQRTLCSLTSANKAFLLTLLAYTLVHVSSGNFMLTMAAMVCGLAWGLLYRLRPQWFASIVISHAVWDAAVFVWFPI